MSKKTVLGIFRFVSMLFFKYLKRVLAKIGPRYFQIRKYAFFKYLKKVWTKNLS